MFFLKAFLLALACSVIFWCSLRSLLEYHRTSVKMLVFLAQVLLVLEAPKQIFGQKKDFSSEIIWFPIDGFKGGIQSTLGEIFLTGSLGWRDGLSMRETWYKKRNTRQAEQFNPGSHQNFVVRERESRRGLLENSASKERNDEDANLFKFFGRPTANTNSRRREMNFWDLIWPSPPRDAIVFPGLNNANEKGLYDVFQDVAKDCERSCPVTPQFNPICGSDGVNYNNLGALKCAQYCGKRVTLSHYGVCGSGLPNIFKPRPRRPKSTTAIPLDRNTWNNW